MSLPLVFRIEVSDEVDAACTWYDRQREGLGEEFLNSLTQQLDRIQQNPEMYAELYKGVRGAPMRRFQ
jgi:toxin ParE1/3/4